MKAKRLCCLVVGLTVIAFLGASCGGDAQRFDVEGVVVSDPWVTAGTTDEAQVYMGVTTKSNSSLLGVEVPESIASGVEMYSMVAVDDPAGGATTELRSVDSVDLLADEPAVFEPGGARLVLVDLVGQLEPGSTFDLVLLLRDGIRLPVQVEARSAG